MFANQQKNINGKTYINTKMELSIDMVKMFQCIGCYEISNTYRIWGSFDCIWNSNAGNNCSYILFRFRSLRSFLYTYFMYSENVCFQHYPVAKHIWNISDMSSR